MNMNTHYNRWYVLLVICISLLVISLDNTILNVALPSIAGQLDASASDLQWIVDSYVLVFASLLLTMGSVSDKYGRKRMLQVGLILFGAGSTAAGLSQTTGMLIAMRAFMGVGGAIIMPATLSIITATFRDPAERSKAIGIWAAVFALGIGIGPVVGGWLLEHFTWNVVFFVNIPIVIIGVISTHFVVQESKDENAPPPDVPGVILSIVGLFALVYGIIEAGMYGWAEPHVLQAFAASAVVLVIFGWWEHRSPHAMLPARFFRNMSFTGANLAITLTMFSMFGSLFFMSQFFQSVQGYTALEAGLRIFPMALASTTAAALSSRTSARFGVKATVGVGFLVAATGLFYLSRVGRVDTAYPVLLLGLATISAGIGSAMPPATDSIMGSVPVNKAGVGSAMNDTTRQLGGALGVAVLGTIMNRTYLHNVETLLENPMLANLPEQATEAIRSSIYGAHYVAEEVVSKLPLVGENLSNVIKETTSTAFVTGMQNALLVAAAIMVGAAVVTLLILPARIRPWQEDDAGQLEAPVAPAAAKTGD